MDNNLFILLLCFFCCCANAVYVDKQIRSIEEIIVPYKQEVAVIIDNVLKKQQTEIFNQQSTVEIKKNQCIVNKDTKSKIISNTDTSILIFISFSMPQESIKGWINQAKKVNAAVYMRGLVNNLFKDTIMAVNKLVQDQPGGILIDPTLFRKYAITQVPAVVVSRGENFDVIYGDVTLDYALANLSKDNVFLAEAINELRKKT
jgi:type-F conjugative transfer system pilin assembly protein TrbC